MECPVLEKYDDGPWWLHDLSDRLPYLDAEDFIRLIDSEEEDKDLEAGQWCIVERAVERSTGDENGAIETKFSMSKNKQKLLISAGRFSKIA